MRTVSRRVVFLATAISVVAAPGMFKAVQGAFDRQLNFSAVPGLPDFRQLSSEVVSTPSFDPFIGLASGQAEKLPIDAVAANLDGHLFRTTKGLPVASFSDFYCPICRDFTELLFELEASEGLALTWHELPIFGEPSVIAARGAIAARAQGAYPEFHRRMMRTSIRADRALISEVARQIGLNVAQFQADAAAEATGQEIRVGKALAEIFGIYGTPSMIVGRTLAIGRLTKAKLLELIKLEYDELSNGV